MAARFHESSRRLAEHCGVGRPEGRGRAAASFRRPLCLLADLFARIEDVGDVQGGSLDGHGEGEHDGEPAFHVGGAQARQHVAFDTSAPYVRLPGHRVEVSGEKHP